MKKLALLGSVLMTGGCSQTDSGDVLTHAMYASISATSAGDGSTTVSTTLFIDNPIYLNFVSLSGDDKLVATHAGEMKTMVETELLNVVGHTATFSTDAEGELFEVAFLRTVDAGAPNSSATLPAKFTVDPPPANASRAAALTLTYGPSGLADAMRWQAEGDCIELATGSLPSDTGAITIAPATIKKRMGDMIADNCQMKITITRARPGTLDPGYGKGGSVEGQQVQTVMLQSVP